MSAHGLAPRRHRAALEVDLDLPGDDRLAAGPAAQHLGAAQGRLDPAAELAHRERLGDVVVGPHLEAEDLVDLVVLGGEHDDRHLAAAAQPPADLDPVELRQHDVEHDQVEALLGEAVERLAAVERGDDLVAVLAQGIGEQRLDRLLVVDQQDPRRPSASGLLPCTRSVIADRVRVAGRQYAASTRAMIDFRLYRLAFLPALLAVVVLMFSLEGAPDAIEPATAAGNVRRRPAAAAARQIATDGAGATAGQRGRRRDRRPGRRAVRRDRGRRRQPSRGSRPSSTART